MTEATAPFESAESKVVPPGAAVFRIWCFHLASLVFPSLTLVFLWTGPHAWYVAPLFLLPLGALLFVDRQAKFEKRQPLPDLPALPFDVLVYVLAALQLLIVFELVRLFSTLSIFSMDMAMVVAVVGGTSGFSIITAHELIHRRTPWERNLGRLLLCSVLYEHFYTEHLRGHHRRVATEEDPATAKFGESYAEFWRRTVPGQFRSAWNLERARLGDPDMSLFDRRMLGNRVLHGLAVEWTLALGVLFVFGPTAFVAFLLQAFIAVRLLEIVNYFEHWGLVRKSARVRPQDSWDTYSRFTYYGLTGLSRHADHHAHPSRPYQQLRVHEEAPELPTGYVGLIDMVFADNEAFMKSADEELRRCRLGPYAPDATAEERARLERWQAKRAAGDDESAGRGPLWIRRLLAPLPETVRPLAFWGALVVVFAIGASLEAGGVGARDFAAILGRNVAILAVFAGAIATQRWLARRTEREGLAWIVAFVLLFVVGHLSRGWLA
jgi:alkane 1-monooxygenase